jgi:hypothetical protein
MRTGRVIVYLPPIPQLGGSLPFAPDPVPELIEACITAVLAVAGTGRLPLRCLELPQRWPVVSLPGVSGGGVAGKNANTHHAQ